MDKTFTTHTSFLLPIIPYVSINDYFSWLTINSETSGLTFLNIEKMIFNPTPEFYLQTIRYQNLLVLQYLEMIIDSDEQLRKSIYSVFLDNLINPKESVLVHVLNQTDPNLLLIERLITKITGLYLCHKNRYFEYQQEPVHRHFEEQLGSVCSNRYCDKLVKILQNNILENLIPQEKFEVLEKLVNVAAHGLYSDKSKELICPNCDRNILHYTHKGNLYISFNHMKYLERAYRTLNQPLIELVERCVKFDCDGSDGNCEDCEDMEEPYECDHSYNDCINQLKLDTYHWLCDLNSSEKQSEKYQRMMQYLTDERLKIIKSKIADFIADNIRNLSEIENYVQQIDLEIDLSNEIKSITQSYQGIAKKIE